MTPAEKAASEAWDVAVSATGPPTEIAPSARRDPDAPPVSKSVLLEHAYEEYYRRLEEGERLDLSSYCASFPSCRSALQNLLQIDLFAGKNPQYFGLETAGCPVAGEQRGDLTIVRQLGRGAFARVFLARETSTGGRLVAVKFSRGGEIEARTMGRLSHPHIVPILSAGRDHATGLTVVRMPYLGSATLEDVLDRLLPSPHAPRPRKAAALFDVLRACAQPEDPPADPDPRLRTMSYADGVIHLAVQLAEALAFLHERGVCHRDLKLSNVLLDPSGKPLLLDFNLSSSALESDAPRGATLRYAAPEQLRAFLGENTAAWDERADLFSLGVIVYELLTGDKPYGSVSPELIEKPLARVLLERWTIGFRSFRGVCPELERPVAAVLDRCLSLDPVGRPRSAAVVAAELRRQFSPARRLRRWIAVHPRMVLATVCLFALTAAIAGYAWSVTPPYSEREYQQGVAFYRAGNYDEAEKHFDQAVRRAGQSASPLRSRLCSVEAE